MDKAAAVWFGPIAGGVGVAILSLGLALRRKARQLRAKGVRTTGAVVESVSRTSAASGQSARYAVVEFSVGEHKFRFETRGGTPWQGKERTVPVLYDPDEPGTAIVDTFVESSLPWVIVTIVGAALCAVGAVVGVLLLADR